MIKRLLASVAMLFMFTTVNAQDTESDFSRRTLSTNLEQPMAMEVDPSGNILIVGRCGRLYVWSANTESVQQTSAVDVRCDLELGLIGITLDPNYEDNRWVYLHYNPDGESTQRVSRFEMNANNSLDLGSEIVMLEYDVQTAQCCHQGGDLEFGPDGNLYISVGDNVNPFRSGGFTPIDERSGRAPWDAQGTSGNTNDLRGKILRIRPNNNGSYSIPNGNLFAGDSQRRPEIYVMGNRNPFRMTVDEQTGYLYWGEVGPDSNSANSNRGPAGYDEINQARRAGNYGWPYVSGFNEPYNDYNFSNGNSGARFNVNGPANDSPNNTGASVLPAAQPAWLRYPHAAMMAGLVYHYDENLNSSQRLPRSFDGKLIFWNFNNGDIFTAEMDANGNNPDASVFFDDLTNNRSLIDMTLDNQDRMLVLGYDRNFNGELHRIEFGGDQGTGNQSPTVVASVTPGMGSLPLRVNFSAAGTTDPDGDSLTYAWDFTTNGIVNASGQQTSHVYTVEGQYNAQLRVTDTAGNSVVRNFTILAGLSTPEVLVTSPANGSFFDYGEVIDWRVSVADSNSPNGVNCDDIVVELVFGHVTGPTEHEHGLIAGRGCSGSFETVEDSGHDGEDVFLALIASYTNSDDITANGVAELRPRFREAEHWTEQSGVETEATLDIDGGLSAAFINNGDWLMFRDMNLVNVDEINVRVASATQGGTIQARIGGVTGQIVGTLEVENTGGWQVWQTLTMPLSSAARTLGANDLFFTFSGTAFSGSGNFLFNINWFDFIGDASTNNTGPVNPAPTPVNPSPAPINPTPAPVNPEPGPGGITQRIQAESFVAQSGIQTETTSDVGGGQNVGFVNNGDSSDYVLAVPSSGTYNLAFRVASRLNGGVITLTRDGAALASVEVPVTGAWQSWVTIETTANLTSGTNVYRLEYSGASGFLFNLNWFELSEGNSTAFNSAPVTVNPTVVSVSLQPDSPSDSGGLSARRIQAESLVAQSGIRTQATSDIGGGQNIGFINSGDSSDYVLAVPASGTYDFAFRVASFRNGGTITLTRGGVALASVEVPVTGNWQNWVTVETTANLTAGTELYRLEYSGVGGFLFNVNWFEFSGD